MKGTAVGDPIEAAAIGAVFGRSTDVKDPLYIGSLKSNIGHLEGASGVVAIIKAAMMLEKGFILPNCNFQKPNPAIPFDKWQMKVSKAITLLISTHIDCSLGPHQAASVAKTKTTSSVYQ